MRRNQSKRNQSEDMTHRLAVLIRKIAQMKWKEFDEASERNENKAVESRQRNATCTVKES